NRGLSRRRDQDDSLKRGASVSTPFHKYDHVCCVDFRFGRGATREHPPQWGCDRGATKPEPKSDATLWAAVLFGPDFVAHSLQTAEGYALVPVRKHLAPRLGQKSLTANVVVFMKWGTKPKTRPGSRRTIRAASDSSRASMARG